MRLPWAAVVGGTLVALMGAAGLVRAAVPQSAASSSSITADAPPIVVTGAYVVAPVAPTELAAAYFTVRNTTGIPDTLESVITGAGAEADLHVVQPDGTMVAVATGVTIPAHGTFTLSTGKGHVMISKLYGSVKPGQTVNIDLQFKNAGPIEVVAPVIAVGTPAPTGATPSSSTPSSSTPSSSTPSSSTPSNPASSGSTPSGEHS